MKRLVLSLLLVALCASSANAGLFSRLVAKVRGNTSQQCQGGVCSPRK